MGYFFGIYQLALAGLFHIIERAGLSFLLMVTYKVLETAGVQKDLLTVTYKYIYRHAGASFFHL